MTNSNFDPLHFAGLARKGLRKGGQQYLKVAAHELFPCAKDHAAYQFCLQCNTKNIQNYLIRTICLTKNCAACFDKTFDKTDANVPEFKQQKMTKFGKMPLR